MTQQPQISEISQRGCCGDFLPLDKVFLLSCIHVLDVLVGLHSHVAFALVFLIVICIDRRLADYTIL